MDDLIEALQILGKYCDNPRNPTHCEHDKLTIMEVNPRKVSPEDLKRLEELGFLRENDPADEDEYDDDPDAEDSFYSYRFGSA